MRTKDLLRRVEVSLERALINEHLDFERDTLTLTLELVRDKLKEMKRREDEERTGRTG